MYCGGPVVDIRDPNAIVNPTLVAKVLSPTTEKDDRTHKFAHYRLLPSLREYMLFATRECRIEAWRPDATGSWGMTAYGAGETVPLPSLGITFGLDQLYAGVELEP